MAVLETRNISGRGLLRLSASDNDYKKAKIFTLYIDVIRRPTNEYLNVVYNEPESRYAIIRLYRGGYCIRTIKLATLHEAFDFYLDPAAQALYAVECAYDGILQSFANLGTALGLTVTSVVDYIKDWNHTDLMWDEAKVVCYNDTAIRMTVRTNAYDLCPEQEDKQGDPPPPPPPTKPSVPPGTPLAGTDNAVDPPYEGEDDGGDTIPYPDDVTPPPPEFPQGIQCTAYAISIYWTIQGFRQTRTVVVYGKVEFVGLDPSNLNDFISVDYGDPRAPGAQCLSSPRRFVMVSSSMGFDAGGQGYSIAPY
jgi:hypothetical protein